MRYSKLIAAVLLMLFVSGCSLFGGGKPGVGEEVPQATAPLDEEGYGKVELLVAVSGGELEAPAGVAVSSEGDVYVSDDARQVVLRFPQGDLKADPISIGSEGSSLGQFIHPRDLALDDSGNLYVLDDGNSRVQFIPADGGTSRQFGRRDDFVSYFSLQDGYDEPLSALAVDQEGNVYVGVSGANYDITSNAIIKFSPQGERLWEVRSMLEGDIDILPFTWPDAMVVDDDGTLYITHGANGVGKIFVLPQKDGQPDKEGAYQFGLIGKGPGELMHTPGGIALTQDDDVLVADTYNNRLQLFTKDGTLKAMYRLKGSPTAEFDQPTAVSVAPDGSVYVVDKGNKRVLQLRLLPPSEG
ncbi:MAG: hypothetical protein GX062_03325 [Firmicutes bacterium]|jgi:tripartite motif-containing protein 71|nr:hypothetical protein [Bacillota bacterium]